MHDDAVEQEGRLPERGLSSRNTITLSTSMWIVAAIAAACALVAQIKQNYAAIPPTSTPVCPETSAIPAVVLWIVLGSTVIFAWRRCSIARLAAQVTISCVLVMSRFWIPSAIQEVLDVLWPLACFGVFFVIPILLRHSTRFGDSVLIFADAAFVTLLAYVFVVNAYIPRV